MIKSYFGWMFGLPPGLPGGGITGVFPAMLASSNGRALAYGWYRRLISGLEGAPMKAATTRLPWRPLWAKTLRMKCTLSTTPNSAATASFETAS